MPEICRTTLQMKHIGFYYVTFRMCLTLTFIHLLKTFGCSNCVLIVKSVF